MWSAACGGLLACRKLMSSPNAPDVEPVDEIDLVADLNAQDDDGNGWSLLREARDPTRVGVGRMLLAGNPQATAIRLTLVLGAPRHNQRPPLRPARLRRHGRRMTAI